MSQAYSFKSMPNFRRLVPARVTDGLRKDGNLKKGRPLKLFRSSKPDFLTAAEVNEFVQLNIRSVVDLRSAAEYRKADGPKLLDAVYAVHEVLCYKF